MSESVLPMAKPKKRSLVASARVVSQLPESWWRSLIGEFIADDLQHVHHLKMVRRRDRHYRATGDDPRFQLRKPVRAGWYMIELELELPCARDTARFYLDNGAGESEIDSYPLPVRSERLVKRLIHVPAKARLRFDPMMREGEFKLRHFRIVRVSGQFALMRIGQKLENVHPRYGRLTQEKPTEFAQHWADYNSLFEPPPDGLIRYADWIADIEQPSIPSAEAQAQTIAGWAWLPRFSVLVPTYDTPEPLLRECLDSVLRQTYPHWQLCIADDASTAPHVRDVLRRYAEQDARVRLVMRERNGHIVAATNSALAIADGEFIALLDHDDVLASHALFAVAQALQLRASAQIVYSDEDKIDEFGERCDPFFKPDWSPDLARSQNYVSHLGVYRRELVEAAGGFRAGFEGSQDYDLLLRCSERVTDAADIVHLPQVLYHWRKVEGSTARGHAHKDYASDAGLIALQQHAEREGRGVSISMLTPGRYRHHWPLPQRLPLVSLIIPTRDGLDVLRTCIDSIVTRTTYTNYEILVVDNQSSDPATLDYFRQLPEQLGDRVRVLGYDDVFNYSAINNFAAAHARGEILGLINNDIEVISPDWLTEMVSHALRPEIGCVGAKLYYPDDTIQHAGVVLGIGGVAGHSHKYFKRDHEGYFSRLHIVHNVSAVTAAVLLVRKTIFDEVGGLDAEHLHVNFNDVDFCLKVREAGYLNLWTPFAELYHHESKTRGRSVSGEREKLFHRECAVMLERWGAHLRKDRFYNPNLSLIHENYSLGGIDDQQKLNQWVVVSSDGFQCK